MSLNCTCVVVSEEIIDCNGTIYQKEEQPLSYTDSEFWIYCGIYVGLVLFAGLTSGLTIGYFSLDITTIKTMTEGGNEKERKYAKKILPLLKQHHLLLVSLLLACSAAEESMPIFLDKLVSPVYAVVVSVVSVLIFAEVIPQSITAKYGLAIGATLSPLVYVLIAITCIVTWPISKVLDCLLGSDHGTFYKRSQFKVLVDLHADDGCSENGLEEPFTQDEVRIIKGTLDMKVKTTEDIIVPIDDVFMINVDDTLNKGTLKVLQEIGFSRIPIYEGNRDNIVTVLLTKTLLCLDPYQTIPIRALLSSKATRDVIFVQPDLPLFDLLYELKGPKGHLAFVKEHTRSYSLAPKIMGIITLEDLMEELLQENIVDETDVDVNIDNKLEVANTKRASISQVIEKQIRNRINKTTTTPTPKKNYRSVSVPDIDVAPFYNNTKNSSRQSIPCILESTTEDTDETSPLIN
ncbi:uncharacterized protein LOC143048310 [Mytilus galloprovincialis]|uniref:uncharacterized protein LOC143048310 n=1 Tax=Mytilus galloprovincialis TaxID=29158 RepID=UPI003F7B450C